MVITVVEEVFTMDGEEKSVLVVLVVMLDHSYGGDDMRLKVLGL